MNSDYSGFVTKGKTLQMISNRELIDNNFVHGAETSVSSIAIILCLKIIFHLYLIAISLET